MGDRCFVGVNIRPQDRERFNDLLGEEEMTSGNELFLGAGECNFALGVGDGDSGELPNDIPYYGSHSAGDNYGAAEFACDGKEFKYWPSVGDCYAVRFDAKTGEPNQQDLEEVKTFLLFLNKVKAMMNQPTTAPAI